MSTTSAERQADWRNALLVALLGLTLGALYFIAIDLQAPNYSFSQQQNVIQGTAGSPYRYRVLVPFVLSGLTHVFAFLGPPQTAYLGASLVYDCVALVFQLLMLYALFRQFFSPLHSLLGVSFIGGVTVLTLAYFTYQPWSILEVAFFALGFVLAYRGRWAWVGVVVVLASVNRETGVFLPLALFLASLQDLRPFGMATLRRAARRRETYLSFAFLMVSVLIFGGLRLVRGSADPVDELDNVIVRNIQRNNVIAAASAIPLVLGFGWLYAALGYRRAPRFLRGVARVLPFYLLAFAIWGWWREVRILTTLYPILVPLVLVYCCDSWRSSRSSS
ncbi:MAG: hypothetical protein JO057_03925 [Chloroflexi bacterium]|nr:hypothetical protein [Chloroflexota bacterium]